MIIFEESYASVEPMFLHVNMRPLKSITRKNTKLRKWGLIKVREFIEVVIHYFSGESAFSSQKYLLLLFNITYFVSEK